jgi:hypothetical protein
VLFIFDDPVVWLKSTGCRTIFWKFIANRRHLINSWKFAGKNMTLSYIITGQKFKLFPHLLRSCTTGWILFRLTPAEWKAFHADSCYDPAPLKLMSRIMYKHWGSSMNSHQFVYFNVLPYPYIWLGYSKPLITNWEANNNLLDSVHPFPSSSFFNSNVFIIRR